jgi:hypothetical protein
MLVPVYCVIKPAIALVPHGLLERSDRMLVSGTTATSPFIHDSASRSTILLLVIAGTFAFAIPLAVLSMFLFVAVCRRLFPRLGDGDLLALTFFFSFGTLTMAFASNLSHTSTAAALVWIAVATLLLTDDRFGRSIGIGALLGLAPTIDYPGALFASLAGALVLLRTPSPRRMTTAAALAVGAVPPALASALYHLVAFGSPFANAYRFRVRGHDRTIFSLAHPWESLPNLQKLFIGFLHPYSGTFLYHPLMLLALPVSLWLAIREGRRPMRWLWLFVAATIATNLFIYCSYPVVVGPASGPEFMVRYTTYSAPFAVLALAALLERLGPERRAARWGLWAIAAFNAIPVWAFAFYGCPVYPTRGYAELLARMGPANYTLAKLSQAGILHNPLWGWAATSFVVACLYAWWRLARDLFAEPRVEPAAPP